LALIEMGRLGEVPVRIVAANVQTIIGIPVDIIDPLDPPEEAYQRPRRQYDAGLVLKHLAGVSFPGHRRILALTTVDLCNPILTYVYGEAELGGRIAVASGFRLRFGEDGAVVSQELYYERLVKTALHEVAHTFSLYHCEEANCLMHFSPKVRQLDRVDICFCSRCEYMLRESLRQTMA
jgi:archaemetzincin